MKQIQGLGQAGDTLVEVLIAILIVSLVLTGAYATTNRSSLGIRNSQEQAEALKLVQGQLEQVRQNGAGAATVFTQSLSAQFCMVDADVVSATTNPEAAKCVQNSAAQPTNEQPAYKLTVERDTCAPVYTPPTGRICHKFTVKAVWDSISTKGQATEIITTRLYE